jgi:hypothetical protein
MSNSISINKNISIEDIPADMRNACNAAYQLGYNMGIDYPGCFESPFESEILTIFWQHGFRSYAYDCGLNSDQQTTLLDCPFQIRFLILAWCDGFRQAEHRLRRISSWKHPKYIRKWGKDGF